ncbi:MAG: S41 family peptidase [Alphaproteobacteria bacterium]|nr:S41 family peptidase [Alphaproteobacteria bacterium]
MWWFLLTGCLNGADQRPTVVFDAVWDDFDQLYGGFDQRGVDWDAARDTYRPQVSDSMSDGELYDVLCEMLGLFDDGHVKLIAEGQEVCDSSRIYREHLMEGTFDIDVVEDRYLTGIDHGRWEAYTRGELRPDLPYLWLPHIDDNTYVVDTIADEHPDAAGFVVDLRHSHGGAFTYANHGFGRLAAEDAFSCRTRSRNGPERGSFDDWFEWWMPAREPLWDVPIVVLIDGETVSASERLLMTLRNLPDTTIIGVTSNGAQATSIGRQLPNGWYLQLPVQEVEGADHVVYEGVGIPPDIELLDDPEVLAGGTDEVLEAAMALFPAR